MLLLACAVTRLLQCAGAPPPPPVVGTAGLPPGAFPALATSSTSPIDEAGHGRGSLEPVEAELSLLEDERACGSSKAVIGLFLPLTNIAPHMIVRWQWKDGVA